MSQPDPKPTRGNKDNLDDLHRETLKTENAHNQTIHSLELVQEAHQKLDVAIEQLKLRLK